ncbi:MAG: hypothetical protein ACOCPW_05435 [Marinilabiliaceae bacterium]
MKKPVLIGGFLLLTGLSITFYMCRESGHGSNDTEPVVRVGNEVLTEKDMEQELPEGIQGDDSANMAENYVNRWVRNKLFLRQAEQNLSEEEKDVSQMLDEYRTSLLVNIYQQKMLEQKYSSMLSDEEIRDYYEEMQDNFTLQENILKGFILKVPLDAPRQSDVRRWCRSGDSEHLVDLENYSAQYAKVFDLFIDEWIPFQRINSNLPEPIQNEERFLRYNRYYEKTDDVYRYFLVINDYMTVGDTAPLSYVEDRIKAILLNKKRGEFIKSLEKELYDEALEKKIINFY